MEEEKDIWYYIREISKLSTPHCDYLIQFMDKYDLDNLHCATLEQTKEFYGELIDKLNFKYTNSILWHLHK